MAETSGTTVETSIVRGVDGDTVTVGELTPRRQCASTDPERLPVGLPRFDEQGRWLGQAA